MKNFGVTSSLSKAFWWQGLRLVWWNTKSWSPLFFSPSCSSSLLSSSTKLDSAMFIFFSFFYICTFIGGPSSFLIFLLAVHLNRLWPCLWLCSSLSGVLLSHLFIWILWLFFITAFFSDFTFIRLWRVAFSGWLYLNIPGGSAFMISWICNWAKR